MKKEVLRRLKALEERRVPAQEVSDLSTLERAMYIGLALRKAADELDAANGTLHPERRAKLSKTLAAARLITATLTKYRPAKVS